MYTSKYHIIWPSTYQRLNTQRTQNLIRTTSLESSARYIRAIHKPPKITQNLQFRLRFPCYVSNCLYHMFIQRVPLAAESGRLEDRRSVSQQLGALQTHTTDTFLFISHTTKVLLFKFRWCIFIGVRIIKEMQCSVACGTACILHVLLTFNVKEISSC